MKRLIITGNDLTIEQVHEVAFAKKGKLEIVLDESTLKHVLNSRNLVTEIANSDEAVYGINTGFGALSDKQIPKSDLTNLQYNLIRSHCTGVGELFDKPTTRAIMLIRLNCLAKGFSGVSLEILQMLIFFLNEHITPQVPSQGSVGASGDLAPLSHIALCLIGEGEVEYENKILSSHLVIENLGKKVVTLGPKDGLSLINGTAVMNALGALAVYQSINLIKHADIIASVTLEAVRGTTKAFHPLISKLKPHPGQLEVVKNLNKLLTESEIQKSHIGCKKVQDPYSLRCIPQVHGAIRQAIKHAQEVISIELNSVTDNPLIFVEEKLIPSGGNFHGEALALAMDYLAIGVSEIANISERRIEKMMNPVFSDLPNFLIKDSGLHSGLMIAHVTAASLASENKYLAHPSSVDSIPTSTDKEDHVSMGVTSGRKLMKILSNVQYTLAIELLCNTQGLELLRPLKSNPAIEKVFEICRRYVSFISNDRVFSKDINELNQLINRQDILREVEKITGELV